MSMNKAVDRSRNKGFRLSHPSDQQKSNRITDVLPTGDASTWPGDWYVYENGRVDGPLSAKEAFSLEGHTPDGKPRLVSRKGFSQWYPLNDLSEIFRLTDQMGRRVEQERNKSEAASLQRFNALAEKPAPKPAKSTKLAKPSRSDKPASIAQPFSQPETKLQSPAFKASVQKTEAAAAKAAAPASTNAAPGNIAPSSSAQAARVSKHELMTEYFLQRGRMRLGKIRQPWLAGFIGLPLSLGIYWFAWFRDLSQEVVFHTQSDKVKMPPAALALVPGFHIYMTYRLAKLLLSMEEQNKYRSISPGLAALFALIPPFAFAYLQEAANGHWLLHARHAATRRLENPDKTYS